MLSSLAEPSTRAKDDGKTGVPVPRIGGPDVRTTDNSPFPTSVRYSPWETRPGETLRRKDAQQAHDRAIHRRHHGGCRARVHHRGVAQADDHSITKLPAKTSLQAGESVSVDVVHDEGFACDSWTTKVVGKKRMRTNVTVSGPESLEGCDVGQPITFQVSLDEEFTKKGRAVVKFIVLSADGSDKKVKSLNVKLNRIPRVRATKSSS